MVQLMNPFSLLAEKHVKDLVGAVEEKAEASFLAAEKKKEKDEKKEKQKQIRRPRRLPVSSVAKSNSTIPISTSTGGSVKSSNGGQYPQEGATDSVSVSSSTSANEVDQTRESKSEEAKKTTKKADPDAEGWQLVQYQTRKKGPRSGNHGPTKENQGATGNNHVNVEEGIRQLQEVARGMNGSQGVMPRRPNINGSARRRLQKNKAGAGQDQQVQANKNTAAASPDATETAPAQKKSTVTYTLKEFEMMKKNGHSDKSDEQPHQSSEKDYSYKGRRKQWGGNRFNGDIEDVSRATVEKADDTSFSLNPGQFPLSSPWKSPVNFQSW